MRNVVTRTYQPTDYITVAELRQHLRLTANTDDAYLHGLLMGVFDYVSNYLGYQVCKSTVDYFYTQTDGGVFHIPARILSLTSVKYRDSNGDLQTMASTDYDEVLTISANYCYDVTLINNPATLYDYGWRYKVTVVEGFGKSGDSVDFSKIFPESLRNAIYLLAEHFYTQRGAEVVGASVQPLTYGHETLLSPFKIMEFA